MDNTMDSNGDDDTLRKEMLDMLDKSESAPLPVPVEPEPVVEEPKKDFDEDYDFTRQKLKTLVAVGEDALEHYVDIAKERNSPRDFEVLAALLKTTGELVKNVIDTASAKAEIDTAKTQKVVGDKETSTTNNTTIFVGSTKELLERINKENAKTIEG